jgi:hypothetical protein
VNSIVRNVPQNKKPEATMAVNLQAFFR